MRSNNTTPEKEADDEKSPILGSWRMVYAMLITVLILVIVSLYLFSKHFS